jgi:hypothetical protein
MFDNSKLIPDTMKTLYVIFSAVVCVLLGSASNGQSVSHYPKDNYGYLVLRNGLETDYWQVNVIKRQYHEGQVSDIVVHKYELWDTHFMKLPLEYFVDYPEYEFMLEVQAINLNQGIIFSEGPFAVYGDGTPFVPALRWVCNGTTYAWAIQQYAHPSGVGCTYQLQSTGAGVDAFGQSIPLYRYMSEQAFYQAIGSASFCAYHGLQLDNLNPYWVIQFNTEDISSNVFDSDGYPLSGSVVGVQKTLGPWQDAGVVTTSVLGHTWSSVAFETTDYAAQLLNTYSNMGDLLSDGVISELLTCAPAFGLEPANDIPGLEETEIDPLYMDCLDTVMNGPIDMDGDDDTDIYDDMLQYEDCVNNGQTGDWQWISVNLIKEEGELNVVTFDKEDIIDASGQLHLPSFIMEPGLHEVVWGNQSNEIFRLVIENKVKLENTMSESALVNPLVYPVPHVSDHFTIHIESGVTTKISYELLDATLANVAQGILSG